MSDKNKQKYNVVEVAEGTLTNAKSKQLTKDERKQARRNKKGKNTAVGQPSLQQQLYALAKNQLKRNEKWYKLDNNATIFPIMSKSEGKSTFRLSATLYEKVNPLALQQAVNDVIPRFPTMTGAIKRGFLWYYIDKPSVPVVVQQQNCLLALPFVLDGRHSQIRVYYTEYDVAVEFFHSATDGNGGLQLLNSLLACYFEHIGMPVADKTNYLDYRDIPTYEEMADGIPQIAVKGLKLPKNQTVKAKVLDFPTLAEDVVLTRLGYCSATELKNVAKSFGATINELLSAVLLISLAKHFEYDVTGKDLRPVTIMVPIDLRRIFGINTLRNFVNFMVLEYHGGTLQEVIADVQKQKQQQITKEYNLACMSPNYFTAHNAFLNATPLGIKRLVIGAVSKHRGGGVVNSATLSNLGNVNAPKDFETRVLRYEFVLGQEKKPPVEFSVITYNDVCTIAVTDKLCDPITEKLFFRTLADLGVTVTLEADKTEGLQ